MVQYQGGRSRRLPSGAVLHSQSKKKKAKFGRNPIETKIGQNKKKKIRTRGGNFKIKAYSLNQINVVDPKTKKAKKAKIKNLDSNKASVDLQRRSIITKGAVVNTDMGKVRVTSRPGQHGLLNGLLID